jgi:hypothetical protein
MEYSDHAVRRRAAHVKAQARQASTIALANARADLVAIEGLRGIAPDDAVDAAAASALGRIDFHKWVEEIPAGLPADFADPEAKW